MRYGFRAALLLAIAQIAAVGCAASRPPQVVLDQIVSAMQLQPGMQIADLGAGDGEWTEELARVVGSEGHVFATEVDEEDVAELQDRMEASGVLNVTTILGTQLDTGLPDECCDAILMRLVYHHFTDPTEMQDALRRALRPNGRLAVVEITTQAGWRLLPGVPERDGHGIQPDTLLQEMTRGGFEAIERYDVWSDDEDHYCIVFRSRE